MDPNLVFAPRIDGHLHQREAFAPGQDPVVGDRLPALFSSGSGVDQMGGRLPQVGADCALRLREVSFHGGHVAPLLHQRLPVVLKGPLHPFIFGKDQHSGGIPVQPVDNKDAPARLPGLHIVRDHTVGGTGALLLVSHGQKPGGLVHRDQIPVLVEHREGELRRPGCLRREKRDLLPRQQRGVEPGDHRPVHHDLPPGEQSFHRIPGFARYLPEQEGEEGGLLRHGQHFSHLRHVPFSSHPSTPRCSSKILIPIPISTPPPKSSALD